MKDKITDESIKKAIIQAEANMNLDDVNVNKIIKNYTKVLRKEFKNGNKKL